MKIDFKYFLIIILILFAIGLNEIYFEPVKRQNLLQNGRYSIATITDYKKVYFRRSLFPKYLPVYTFSYLGKTYTEEGDGIIQDGSYGMIKKENIGKQYLVVFLPDNPDESSLLPYDRVNDTISSFSIRLDTSNTIVVPPTIDKKVAPFDGWIKSDIFGKNDVDHVYFDPIKY